MLLNLGHQYAERDKLDFVEGMVSSPLLGCVKTGDRAARGSSPSFVFLTGRLLRSATWNSC